MTVSVKSHVRNNFEKILTLIKKELKQRFVRNVGLPDISKFKLNKNKINRGGRCK